MLHDIPTSFPEGWDGHLAHSTAYLGLTPRDPLFPPSRVGSNPSQTPAHRNFSLDTLTTQTVGDPLGRQILRPYP